MKQILAITRKELNSYFGSPMALIFIGVFLAASSVTFFWIDTFFARGIADVRPLFRWMPLLLVFLVAALTMRQWSQENQTRHAGNAADPARAQLATGVGQVLCRAGVGSSGAWR